MSKLNIPNPFQKKQVKSTSNKVHMFGEIQPDSYFLEYFNDKINPKGHLAIEDLYTIKKIFIRPDSDSNVDHISLNIFQYMPNVEELIIYSSKVTNWSGLSYLLSLKRLTIGFQDLTFEILEALNKLPNLENVMFSRLNIMDFSSYTSAANIKRLELFDVTFADLKSLSLFKNLTHISMEKIKINNLEFLYGLKKLRHLILKEITLDNMDFIKHIPSLKKIRINKKAHNEDGLIYLKDCSNLGIMDYPLSDLSVLSECHELTDIGIDADFCKSLNVLEDTCVTCVTVYHSDSYSDAEKIIDQVKQFCRLNSYAYSMK